MSQANALVQGIVACRSSAKYIYREYSNQGMGFKNRFLFLFLFFQEVLQSSEEPGSPRSNGHGFGSSGKRDKYSHEIK